LKVQADPVNQVPIACSLDAGALSARLKHFDDLRREALLDRRAIQDGLRVRLRAAPGVERRTRELIAAEAQCCPFLSFDLCRHERELVLDITGPAGARPIIDEFFAG
jgi:hypothetical protein